MLLYVIQNGSGCYMRTDKYDYYILISIKGKYILYESDIDV